SLNQEALAVLHGSEFRQGEQFSLHQMSEALFRAGRLEEGLQRNSEALDMARSIHDVEAEERVLFQRARSRRAQGRLPESRAEVEASLRIAESFRGSVAAHESRAAYLASVYDRYGLLTDVLMQLGLDQQAFETAERARARGLLDLLAEARAGIRQGVNAELLARERKLAGRLEAASSRQVRLLASR